MQGTSKNNVNTPFGLWNRSLEDTLFVTECTFTLSSSDVLFHVTCFTAKKGQHQPHEVEFTLRDFTSLCQSFKDPDSIVPNFNKKWVTNNSSLSAYVIWTLNHFPRTLSQNDLGLVFEFIHDHHNSSSGWFSGITGWIIDGFNINLSESNSFYNAKKKSPRFSPIDKAFSEIRKMVNICNSETSTNTKPQAENIVNFANFTEQEHTFNEEIDNVTESLIFIGNDLTQLKNVKKTDTNLPKMFPTATNTVIEDITHFSDMFAMAMHRGYKKAEQACTISQNLIVNQNLEFYEMN